jgi:hypothetical protein
MEKPIKKERKRRIKAQNAERKTKREPLKPMSPEERARIEAATLMILDGLFYLFVGHRLAELTRKDEFPSEIDAN